MLENSKDEKRSKEESKEIVEQEEKPDEKDRSYSIVGLYEFRLGKRGRIKLIKMRNPWGTCEWEGDWSEQSPLWTPETR